jgi:predicted ArsR family transcriptional regulator
MEPAFGSTTAPRPGRSRDGRWGLFTNHFLVLASIAVDPGLRVRDIADMVGVTERATQAILRDLIEDGYVERIRTGRRNSYRIRRSASLRHPLGRSHTVGELLDLLSHELPAVVHPAPSAVTTPGG